MRHRRFRQHGKFGPAPESRRARVPWSRLNGLRVSVAQARALFVSLLGLVSLVGLTWVSSSAGGVAGDDSSEFFDRPQGQGKKEFEGGKEDEKARSRNARVFEFEDGRRVAMLYPGSIHFKDEDDKWEPIDNTLVDDNSDSYDWHNKANRYKLKLPGSLEKAPVKVEQDGSWLSYQLEDAKGGGEASGSEAQYKNALPYVDVIYRADNDAVKEILSLQNDNAPEEFRFRLQASPDLEPREREGKVEFIDSGGKARMYFGVPFMQDASGTDEGFSDDVELKLDRDDGGWVVVLRPSQAFLNDSDRQWPVALDPTINFRSSARDCHIVSGSSENDVHCAQDSLTIGHNNSKIKRALVRFGVADELKLQGIRNKVVLTSEFTLHQKSGTASPDPKLFSVQGVGAIDPNDKRILDTTWDADQTTWRKRDTNPSTLWHSTPTTGGGGDFLPGGDPEGTKDDNNYRWYPTDVVQNWFDDTRSDDNVPNDDGFIVLGPVSGSTQLEVDSHNASNSGNWPQLVIDYTARVGMLRGNQFADTELTDRMSLHVNLASGNLVLEANDLNIAGTAGHDLSLSRFYNNRSGRNGDFGNGWSMNMGVDVNLLPLVDGSVAFFGPSGYVVRFQKKPDGTFATPPGLDATLIQKADKEYVLQFDREGTRYVFAESGKLLKLKDQHNNEITFDYSPTASPLPELQKITDTQGRQITFDHNDRFITAMHDLAGGRNYAYRYNASDPELLETYTDPAGKVTRFGYTNRNLTSVTDPRGNETRIAYDGQNRVTSITQVADGPASEWPTTTFKYDIDRSPPCPDDAPQGVIVTDPRGNKSTYCADGHDRVDRWFDANGHERKLSWSPSDKPLEYSSGPGTPNERFATLRYSPGKDNLVEVLAPESEPEKIEYNETGPNPYSPTATINSRGTKWKFTYSQPAGGVIPGPISGDNDDLKPPGRLETVQNDKSTSPEVKFDYNADGTVKQSTDGNNHSTTYTYLAGKLVKVTPPLPLQPTEILEYDALGRIKKVKDGKGQITTFTYDAFDRATRETFHDGSFVAYGYDEDGNLTSRQDAGGTASYAYDKLNRLGSESKPTGNSSYGYDKASNLTSVTDVGGTTTYVYNELNFIKELREPGNLLTTFDNNNEGERTRTRYPNGIEIGVEYDNKGRLKKIVNERGLNGPVLKSYQYQYQDGNGKKTDLVFKVTQHDGQLINYDYDQLDRLKSGITKNSGGSIIDDRSYTHDPATNRKTQTINGTTTTYTYNDANQLVSDSTGRTYTYDDNGNETGHSQPRTLTYNAKDQTTSFTEPGLGGLPTTTNFKYAGSDQGERTNAGDRNFHTTELGVSIQAPSVAGLPIPGDLANTYFIRDSLGKLISQRTPLGRHYFLFDGRGSVVGLTDQNGNLVRSRNYEHYGATTSTTGDALVDTPWQYNGEYHDVTGLYKMGQRYYDPATARWTQQDPLGHIGDPRDSNRYTYVGGDPVNLTDPTGLIPRCSLLRRPAAPGGYRKYKCAQIKGPWKANFGIIGRIVRGILGGCISGAMGGGVPDTPFLVKFAGKVIRFVPAGRAGACVIGGVAGGVTGAVDAG